MGTLEPTLEIMTITPAVAEAWLEVNHDNRPVRSEVVRRYARDMQAGNWKVTGDTIKRNGARILDGQHRLAACVIAGVPFTTAVATGVQDADHHAIDTGVKRSVADELRWHGESNCVAVGAILTLVWRHNKNVLFNPLRPTTAELIELWRSNKEAFRQATSRGRQVWRATQIPNSPAGTALYLAAQQDDDAAEQWTQHLSEGTGYEEGDAALALRKYAVNVASKAALRPTQEMWLAINIKAFNGWAEGKPVTTLSWKKVGRGKEPFPTINIAAEGAEQ